MSTAFSGLHHILCATLCTAAFVSSASAQEFDPKELLSLSLEQLSNIEVTSVSKKAEKANEAPAAVFVITADDIRRLGATSIPEALRIVPGLNVARSGSHQWAVTARGFNDQFANKLLVLMDGRTVYTPLFNGVWWDVQDTVLEDIDRIEVIRGPGATLWGANAVNGVINIITKSAKDTQGGLASITTGNQEKAIASTRYGMKIGDNSYARVYAKYNNRDEESTLNGFGADDAWNKRQAGFKAEMELTQQDNLTVQGDVYSANEDFVLNLPSFITPPVVPTPETDQAIGGNMLARWKHKASDTSDIALQVYFDHAKRSSIAYRDEINTIDLDFQHNWSASDRHEITWGVGYRLVDEEMENSIYNQLTPDSRSDNLFSAFLQDKITLVPENLFLTLGSKFEVNDYTGFEYQPSARLAWLINDKQTAWASVSRAVKTPYRFTDDGSLALGAFPFGAPLGFIGSAPNPNLESERLIAYEVGYRIQPVETVSLDTTAFYNDYTNLTRGLLGAPEFRTLPGFGPYLFFPIIPFNDNEARSFGFELAANWEVFDNWQLSAGYSFLDLKFEKQDSLGFPLAGKSPEQQFNVRSNLILPYGLEMNNAVYYVDSLPGIDIPDYVRFDTRLAWRARDGVELSLVGHDLFDAEHPEFSSFIYQNPSQIGRSVYANVTLRF